MPSTSRRFAAVCLAFSLVACSDGPTNGGGGGGGGGGGNNDPGPPAAVAGVSGSGQQVPAAQVAPAPLVVKVTDAQGRAVPNTSVSFAAAAASGTVSAASATTGADGQAQVSWTVGPSAGTHSVSATVGSLPAATFTATVTPNATLTGTVTLVDTLVAATMRLPEGMVSSFRATPKVASTFLARAAGGGSARRPARSAAVPGALIVTLRREATGAPAGGPRARMSRQQARDVAERMRVALEDHAGPGRRVRDVSPLLGAGRLEVRPGTEDAVAAELRRDPRVLRVERDGWAYAMGGVTPNDPLRAAQAWHYQMIDLPRAWKRTTGSNGVLVAVVDDGIRFDHPDIAPNLTADGYDFVSNVSESTPCGLRNNAGDGDGYDPDPTTPAGYDGCTLSEAGGHGLHVAGTIGGVGNNGMGMSGVAWTVRIRPVRVLGTAGTGSYFDIAQGILYAAGLPASNGQGGVVQAASGARIINLSLGGASDAQVMRDAVVAASTAGALLVAAAGNDNTSASFYPAVYPEVLTVSAVGPRRNRASYSNWGPHVDIAAPGGEVAGDISGGIASTQWNFQANAPTYNLIQGTSMAAPHVSGAAALLLALDPSLTAGQLRERLTAYAVDLGTPGTDPVFGAGLLNVRNSLAQSRGIQRRVYGRVYDAATGAIVREVPAAGPSFSVGQLGDGAYHVFAGMDDELDGVIGINGARWGGLTGPDGMVQALAIQGAGTYPAAFSVGFLKEREPNDVSASATRMMLGSSLYGVLATVNDVDLYRVNLPAGAYVFETVGWEGSCGLTINADTELALISPAGATLAVHDDVDGGGWNFCSRITTTVPAGAYTLAVSGYSPGGYRVIVRPAP